MLRRCFVVILDDQGLIRSDSVDDLAQVSVFHHHSVIDNDQSLAQFFNIAKIMCGEDDRRLPDLVDLFDKCAQGELA